MSSNELMPRKVRLSEGNPETNALLVVNINPNINWGYPRLSMFAIALSDLQVLWNYSEMRKHDLARPMSGEKFRRSLEGI